MSQPITHPLPLETKIKATKQNCPCRGGGTIMVTGIIKKVITNHSGIWYYFHIGSTVNSSSVTEILQP